MKRNKNFGKNAEGMPNDPDLILLSVVKKWLTPKYK